MHRSVRHFVCAAAASLLCGSLLSQTPELIFKSGFESGSRMIAKYSEANRDIAGKDLSTGMDWEEDLDKWSNLLTGESIGYFVFDYGGGTPTQRLVELVPDPVDPTNTVCEYWIKQANNTISSPPYAKGRVQANMYNSVGLRDLSYSIRWFIPQDFDVLRTMSSAMPWMIVFEYWNNVDWREDGYAFRFNVNLTKAAGSNQPFRLRAKSQLVDGWVTVWDQTNNSFAVPTGQWMTVRIRLKEGNASTGKFYMDITPDGGSTQVIFDISNYTHHPSDPAPDGFKDINPFKLYCHKDNVDIVRNQGADKYLHVYWDDFELWANRSADLPGSATHVTYGHSCDSSVGPTQLDCLSPPRLGRVFELRASGLAPYKAGYFGIGLQDAWWGGSPLPLELTSFGAAGCFVHVEPLSIHFAPSDIAGYARFSLSVPSNRALLGLPIYSQYGSLDRGPGRPAQITTTNAGHGVVGL